MQLTSHLTRFALRIAVAATVLGIAATAGLAGEAKAVNSTQEVVPVVNTVYWDLTRFWNNLTRKPGVGYYNYYYNGVIQELNTGCGSTASSHGTQGFYCGYYTNGDIYFDWTQQNSQLRSIGDGSVALWVAHEYGHHAERELRISWPQPYQELLADCFAGLYFRYGVYSSGQLAYADYLEARTMLSRMGYDDAHGNATQRTRAFDYGFRSVGYTSCVNGWRNW